MVAMLVIIIELAVDILGVVEFIVLLFLNNSLNSQTLPE